MRQRNADRVVDAGGAGERRIKILSIKLTDDFKTYLAGNLPVKLAAREFAAGFAADVNGEWRRRVQEELLGVVIGKNNPEIGLQRLELVADLRRDRAHLLDGLLVFRVRHREELRRMRQHRAANHC